MTTRTSVWLLTLALVACGSNDRALHPIGPTVMPNPLPPDSPMASNIGIYVGTDTGGILYDLPPAPRDASGVYRLEWNHPYTIGMFQMSHVAAGRCRTLVVSYSWNAMPGPNSGGCLQPNIDAMSMSFTTPSADSSAEHRIMVRFEEHGPDLLTPRSESVEFSVRLGA